MAIRKKHSMLKRIISLCSPSAVKAHFSIDSWMRSISPTIREPYCFRYIPIIDLGSTFDLSSVLWSMLLLLLLLLIYCTVQYNTVQYNTVQYSTVQYSTVQYSTVLLQCNSVFGKLLSSVH